MKGNFGTGPMSLQFLKHPATVIPLLTFHLASRNAIIVIIDSKTLSKGQLACM